MRPLGLALLGLVACEAPEPREGIAIGNGPGASLLRGIPAQSLQHTVLHAQGRRHGRWRLRGAQAFQRRWQRRQQTLSWFVTRSFLSLT